MILNKKAMIIIIACIFTLIALTPLKTSASTPEAFVIKDQPEYSKAWFDLAEFSLSIDQEYMHVIIKYYGPLPEIVEAPASQSRGLQLLIRTSPFSLDYTRVVLEQTYVAISENTYELKSFYAVGRGQLQSIECTGDSYSLVADIPLALLGLSPQDSLFITVSSFSDLSYDNPGFLSDGKPVIGIYYKPGVGGAYYLVGASDTRVTRGLLVGVDVTDYAIIVTDDPQVLNTSSLQTLGTPLYYKLLFKNPDDVEWPIPVEYLSTNNTYIFLASIGRQGWQKIRTYSILDKDNVVVAWLEKEEYQESNGVLVVAPVYDSEYYRMEYYVQHYTGVTEFSAPVTYKLLIDNGSLVIELGFNNSLPGAYTGHGVYVEPLFCINKDLDVTTGLRTNDLGKAVGCDFYIVDNMILDATGNIVAKGHRIDLNNKTYLLYPRTILGLETGSEIYVQGLGYQSLITDSIMREKTGIVVSGQKIFHIDGDLEEWGTEDYMIIDDNDGASWIEESYNVTSIYIGDNSTWLAIAVSTNGKLFSASLIDVELYGKISIGDRMYRFVADTSKIVIRKYVGGYYSGTMVLEKPLYAVGVGDGFEIALSLSALGIGLGDTLSLTIEKIIVKTGKEVLARDKVVDIVVDKSSRIVGLCSELFTVKTSNSAIVSITFRDFNASIPLTYPTYLESILTWREWDVHREMISPVTGFYELRILTGFENISWPITISITYKESIIASLGYNESELSIYVYDGKLGGWIEVEDQKINTTANTVTALVRYSGEQGNLISLTLLPRSLMSPKLELYIELPASIKEGDTATISISVKNTGYYKALNVTIDVDTHGPLEITSGTHTLRTNVLPPGGTWNKTLTVKALEKGTALLKIIMEASNADKVYQEIEVRIEENPLLETTIISSGEQGGGEATGAQTTSEAQPQSTSMKTRLAAAIMLLLVATAAWRYLVHRSKSRLVIP